MGLRDIGATLPPGFKFYPSDEELVCHYLYKKITNEQVLKGTLVEIDLHTCEPWQLPEVAKLNANEWYFFSFRDRKYATGFRTNRATASGYWKATGKDRTVVDPSSREVVGMRKTLVFYRNRAPNGIKTGWIMHEFRLETPHMPPKEDWVLCRVFHKGKGDDLESNINNKFNSSDFTFDNTINHHQLQLPCGYQQQLLSASSSTPPPPPDQTLLNFLQLSQETNTTNNPITELISSKGDDNGDYGFFWDEMSLEETSLADGSSGLRFDLGNNTNNMVFL
ncbi:protein CUP-SHAPED COTYLEDON 3-like [Mercurialis annua]|uniref:protein CUP-SHAPED COTYLEDON 3-like n=1 Tax=Mercurialis annua TaxID=3986 RepID=UPI00216012CC|nr:protein CUP-SHAPED COTYLEDON 3-like [Mercurialis annua]